MVNWTSIGLIVLLGVVLLMYFAPSYTEPLAVTAGGPFDLSKRVVIAGMTDASGLLNESSTFQGFFYLNPMMRTGAHVECGTAINQPSCADGSFQPCLCDISGCNSCKHAGFYSIIDLIGIAGIEVMPAPDASRQGSMAAQLIVKTEMMASGAMSMHQLYVETIPLPYILAQKWTMITVTREGRQFDVYYNDKLVMSHKTMYMPISTKINSNLTGLVSGSDGLIGTLANVSMLPKRITIFDVESDYTTLADTRGAPVIGSESIKTLATTPSHSLPGLSPSFGSSLFSFKFPSFDFCKLTGLCNAPITSPTPGANTWVNNYG